MIPQTEAIRQVDAKNANADTCTETQIWQRALANVVKTPQELYTLLELSTDQLPAALAASQDFALRVPRAFVQRMQKNNWDDPLLKQVLPLGRELEFEPGFSSDPLAEADHNPTPGLIHKYQGRVLLIVSGGCAINCRYCFRRHFAYQDNNPSRQQWQKTLDYVRQDDSIHEVILSGGDPLVASDALLSELVQHIAAIDHVKTLRIHTRLPIVIPQRITQQCIEWMQQPRLQTVMVVHCNHANEIDAEVEQALAKLKSAGITLLNQSVLLHGVNNTSSALSQLSQRLFSCGVLPYYLHLLDPVTGAAHFHVEEQHGQTLIQSLQANLPGYLVPKFVKEEPGEPSKTAISSL